jgi:hypothetical protein
MNNLRDEWKGFQVSSIMIVASENFASFFTVWSDIRPEDGSSKLFEKALSAYKAIRWRDP